MRRSLRPASGSASKDSQAPPREIGTYRQPLLVFALVVAVVLLLASRVFYFGPAPWTWLRAARLSLPALLFVGAGFAFLGRLNLRRGRRTLSFLSSSKLRVCLILAWSAAAALVDLASGQGASIFVFGAGAAALVGWKDRRFLSLALSLTAVAAAAGAFFIEKGLEFDTTAMIIAASGMGAIFAWVIRSNVAPNEERLQYLERENKELWNLSFRDGLTGLYNRRFAQETGQKLLNRAIRYHEQFHALMLDIDHFKRVNDKISHAAGDEVLRQIARIIQDCVRSSDFVSRYGGEEFVVFLVQADPELVQNIANRIRDGVATHRFEIVPWQITLSIGVASIQDNESLGELIDRADKYLYVSKKAGRNRVSGF